MYKNNIMVYSLDVEHNYKHQSQKHMNHECASTTKWLTQKTNHKNENVYHKFESTMSLVKEIPMGYDLCILGLLDACTLCVSSLTASFFVVTIGFPIAIDSSVSAMN